MARMSLDDIRGDVAASEAPDVVRIEATTEADIARWNAADGFDPNDTLKGLRRAYSPAEVRELAGLTQAEMAARLTVPVKTWRNWEQGRVTLEPAVRALLALVADDPERAFRVLDGDYHKPVPQPDVEEIGRQAEAEEERAIAARMATVTVRRRTRV